MYAVPDPRPEPIEQPVEQWEECNVFGFRTITLKEPGHIVAQHVHDDDHATLVCNGRARCWVENRYEGEKGPGEAFEVKGGKKHVFQAVEAMTRLACVTHLPRKGA